MMRFGGISPWPFFGTFWHQQIVVPFCRWRHRHRCWLWELLRSSLKSAPEESGGLERFLGTVSAWQCPAPSPVGGSKLGTPRLDGQSTPAGSGPVSCDPWPTLCGGLCRRSAKITSIEFSSGYFRTFFQKLSWIKTQQILKNSAKFSSNLRLFAAKLSYSTNTKSIYFVKLRENLKNLNSRNLTKTQFSGK